MQISSAKKARLRAAFNPDFHPRYPAGHPLGGQFMPKGSNEYKTEIKEGSKTRKQFRDLVQTIAERWTTGKVAGTGKMIMDAYDDNPRFQLEHPDREAFMQKVQHEKAVIMGNSQQYYQKNLTEGRGVKINPETKKAIAKKIKSFKQAQEVVKDFPKIVRPDLSDKKTSLVETVDGHKVEVRLSDSSTPANNAKINNNLASVSNSENYKDIPALDISFTVNDSYDKIGVDKKTGIKIALKARTMSMEIIKQLPDGVIVFNTPNDHDGHGKGRAKVYKSAGFSDEMISVIANGKFKAITRNQLAVLRQNSDINQSPTQDQPRQRNGSVGMIGRGSQQNGSARLSRMRSRTDLSTQ